MYNDDTPSKGHIVLTFDIEVEMNSGLPNIEKAENEITKPQGVHLPPFACFADGHFGMTSCLDIQVPDGYVLRMESHPRFYTDTTNTVPCVVFKRSQS